MIEKHRLEQLENTVLIYLLSAGFTEHANGYAE